MTIDTKELARLVCRKAEVQAEITVYVSMSDFIKTNMERTRAERNHCEGHAWATVLGEVISTLKILDTELTDINMRLNLMKD